MRQFLLKLTVFCVGLLILGELFFRFVIPASDNPTVSQEIAFNLIIKNPQDSQRGLFTSGRYAEQQIPWQINDLGWNYNRQYKPNSEVDRPIVAMTGDSQIEGFYVNADQHVLSRLEVMAEGGFLGYSLGSSGYKIAEYILVARYLAVHGIQPDVYIMYVNRGDFWRAIVNLGGRLGTPSPRLRRRLGQFELVPGGAYPKSLFRSTLRHSALVRYLIFNARLNPFKRGTADLGMTARRSYPEANADADPIYEQAVAYMVEQIGIALPKAKIVFVIDADRRAIVAGKAPRVIGTSIPIQKACRALGCLALDLTDAFTTDWTTSGRPFQFAKNYHWNAHGHEIAANALFDALNQRKWLPRRETSTR